MKNLKNPKFGKKEINFVNKEHLEWIEKYIKTHHLVFEDLEKQTEGNVDELIAMRSYRGLRHSLGLPAHGQRTRSNAINARNNRFRKGVKDFTWSTFRKKE